MTTFAAIVRRSTIALVAAAGLHSAAHAQSSPAPVGTWQSDSGEVMVIGPTCSLQVNGTVTSVGACSWNPTSAGGILMIMSVMTYHPAPVYFNVIWVDQYTIQVEGDTFHRAA